jgi:hypothetical protein
MKLRASITVLPFALATSLVAAEPLKQSDERPEDYPAGAGREPTFYACTPCHGFKIVAQQGQTRRQWDDTLNWMTERHGMPPVDGELRKIVLDYLEATYPPRQVPGGWKNLFAK